MTWIELAWTMMASASLTLAGIHLFAWLKNRSDRAHFWFFALAASVPLFSVMEVLAIEARTAAEYAVASRWAQVPLFFVVVSFVIFVRTYFNAGRAWIAYGVVGTRALTLLLNFTTGDSVLHTRIADVVHTTFWGAAVTTPVGELSPWALVPQASNVLLLAFVADATVALWRRGGATARRRALLVGGALVFCVVVPLVLGLAITAGLLRAPTPLTACFFVVVVAMGYELGRDVLEVARLSTELRESERRTDLAARAAELAFWSWDPQLNEVWMSPKGGELFDVEPTTHLSREALLARVHAGDRDALRDATQRALQELGQFEQEFRVVLRHGGVRWLAARGQAEARAGAPALIRGVTLDITVRRRLEREAIEQRNELAHLARVATLGELSGSLAHEINQPLMGILSNAQAALRFMTAERPDLDEVRDILADIVEDDKRAGEVIRRLRALLKKGEVQRSLLDVRDVVDDVMRVTRNDLLNRDIVLHTDIATGLAPVLGDRIQLQQVLLNLIMNACDAIHGSEAREIILGARARDGAVEFTVTDSGPGIPQGNLERIFEPFVSTKEHGTGLGLSVCRTIVAAHGGRLWAENQEGGGATFRFLLPVVAADADVTSPAGADRPATQPWRHAGERA
ncbi:MAG: HAMP domain-containing histidine kinase [Burkholderiales bacterium]|nr:HAMP domain-containing histidine kinase [Burkholderiales bacterium]